MQSRCRLGEAKQPIELEVAEHSKFITRSEENIYGTWKPDRLHYRITSYPECEMKRHKNRLPMASIMIGQQGRGNELTYRTYNRGLLNLGHQFSPSNRLSPERVIPWRGGDPD
ncbi:Uncharacterized protein APZ42_012029 [Daphnia magna]|uniref:Uncharacterized protein n=1 Tax=Daphnia magna TaxID=35525 RepID=A0A162S9W3_9CRUS|nr:Uncharacterized protein APZ42_012029 [Daphnia magna]